MPFAERNKRKQMNNIDILLIIFLQNYNNLNSLKGFKDPKLYFILCHSCWKERKEDFKNEVEIIKKLY